MSKGIRKQIRSGPANHLGRPKVTIQDENAGIAKISTGVLDCGQNRGELMRRPHVIVVEECDPVGLCLAMPVFRAADTPAWRSDLSSLKRGSLSAAMSGAGTSEPSSTTMTSSRVCRWVKLPSGLGGECVPRFRVGITTENRGVPCEGQACRGSSREADHRGHHRESLQGSEPATVRRASPTTGVALHRPVAGPNFRQPSQRPRAPSEIPGLRRSIAARPRPGRRDALTTAVVTSEVAQHSSIASEQVLAKNMPRERA